MDFITKIIGSDYPKPYFITESILKRYAFVSVVSTYNKTNQLINALIRAQKDRPLGLKILTSNYCFNCFDVKHTIENCNGCAFCLKQSHKSRNCPDMRSELEEQNRLCIAPAIPKDIPLKKSTIDFRNYQIRRGFLRIPTQNIGFWAWDYQRFPEYQSQWKDASMDVEKGFTNSGQMKAIRVVAHHHPTGKSTCEVLITANINNKDVIKTAIPHSNTYPTDYRGVSAMDYKLSFLPVMRNKTLYMWDAINGLNSLDVTQEECDSYNILVIDLQLMPIMRDPNDFNQKTSLMKAVYAYLKIKIQEVDPIIRQGTGHNCEIESRVILKLGEKIHKSEEKNERLLGYAKIEEKWILGIKSGDLKLNMDKINGRTKSEVDSIIKEWEKYESLAKKMT